ncbi:hypothetical protein [Natronomonas sp.]|uniref:hypothetical protein n=1 Tax=Natronomonas sp. TaxID=2184060 RepID=UPI002FC2C721
MSNVVDCPMPDCDGSFDAVQAAKRINPACPHCEATWGECHGQVDPEQPDDAIPAAEREERQRSLSRLTYEQRLLFETLPEEGSWLQSEELHATYDEVSEQGKSRRTRRNWLQKMQHYNLIEKGGEGRGTKYRRLVTQTPTDSLVG